MLGNHGLGGHSRLAYLMLLQCFWDPTLLGITSQGVSTGSLHMLLGSSIFYSMELLEPVISLGAATDFSKGHNLLITKVQWKRTVR